MTVYVCMDLMVYMAGDSLTGDSERTPEGEGQWGDLNHPGGSGQASLFPSRRLQNSWNGMN